MKVQYETGIQSIFNTLLDQEVTLNPKKGRSSKLLAIRNELIKYRYYYYIKIKRSQYNEAIKSLSGEFFLCERTITDLLTKDAADIKRIIAAAPNNKTLKSKYPIWEWI